MNLNKKLKPEIMALERGFTARTWSDEHYGYLELTGVDDVDRPFLVTLSSITSLPKLRDAIRRLEGGP